MIHLRIADPVNPGAEGNLASHSRGRAPRLGIPWTGWRQELTSSILMLLRGPSPPKKFQGGPYFRDCWVESRFPKLAFTVAIVLQVALVLFPPPIWNVKPQPRPIPNDHEELTYYSPTLDLPKILPSRRAPATPAPAGETEADSKRGADAFHPRQTIISAPLHPTHPRQTLIQPAAPPEPPKILPSLPNIVQFAASEPVRPKALLTPEQLAAMRPNAPTRVKPEEVAVPQVDAQEKQLGAIPIASSANAPPKPVLPVNPMSAPRPVQRSTTGSAAAPDIGMGSAGTATTIIALSATPGPPAPPPAGNLTARISISPDGAQPGSPSGPVNGKSNAGLGGPGGEIGASGNSAGSGNGRGPEGIFIGGGNSANQLPPSGLGIGSTARSAGSVLPSRLAPRMSLPRQDSTASSAGTPNIDPSAPPESVLGTKRVYTLHVNMPNLTSASGSWILSFAELDEKVSQFSVGAAEAELVGPVPLRKVDPKYPPELRIGRVEGEVILYAVIRKDGTVDSIQLVHGVDTHLDANAMDALAQWKFRPAEKHGAPIDLEAVIHIPFHSRAPTY